MPKITLRNTGQELSEVLNDLLHYLNGFYWISAFPR